MKYALFVKFVFSLPLFVRENTILPMREGVHLPDYDYREDTKLHLYEIKDGILIRMLEKEITIEL